MLNNLSFLRKKEGLEKELDYFSNWLGIAERSGAKVNFVVPKSRRNVIVCPFWSEAKVLDEVSGKEIPLFMPDISVFDVEMVLRCHGRFMSVYDETGGKVRMLFEWEFLKKILEDGSIKMEWV